VGGDESDLVWLGGRSLCIASSFMAESEREECDSVVAMVFTGVAWRWTGGASRR
jgi:hypothetical protein